MVRCVGWEKKSSKSDDFSEFYLLSSGLRLRGKEREEALYVSFVYVRDKKFQKGDTTIW